MAIRYKPISGLNNTSLNKLIEISGKDFESLIDKKANLSHLNASVIQLEKEDYKSDYKYYQAMVNNIQSINYVDMPVQIYVNFRKGECISEKCIEVLDESGNSIPFQYEGTKNPNINQKISSLGYYSDNSLKSGTLWLIDSINANSTKNYLIKVYASEIENNFIDNILVAETGESSTNKINITANNHVFTFGQTSLYQLRYITSNGVNFIRPDNTDFNTCYGANIVQVGFTFADGSPELSRNQAPTSDARDLQGENISHEISGSGYVFKDFKSEFKVVKYPNIVVEQNTRIFKTGYFIIKTMVKLTENLPSGTLKGINFKARLTTDTEVYSHEYKGFIAQKENQKIACLSKWVQWCPDGYDTNSVSSTYSPFAVSEYSTVPPVHVSRGYMGWNLTPTQAAFNKGCYWSCRYDFNPNATSTVKYKELDKMYCELIGVATENNIEYNKAKFLKLCKTFFMNNYSKTLTVSSFKGLTALNTIMHNLFNGNYNYSDVLTKFKSCINSKYGGGTTTGFYNAYTSDAGIEYHGRDMATLPYIYEIAKIENDNKTITYLENIIHNFADFFVKCETDGGKVGTVPLKRNQWDTMNSEATAMKFIKLSLNITSNTTRQECYNRILKFFKSTVQFNEVFPYSSTNNIIYKYQGHYHAMTMFEFIKTGEEPSFDTINYFLEMFTPNGQCKEIGYNRTRERYGFWHTSLYSAYCLYYYGVKNKNTSAVQEAVNIMEHLLTKCYPNGYHEYPLDGWKTNAGTIDSPIESQICAMAILDEVFGL